MRLNHPYLWLVLYLSCFSQAIAASAPVQKLTPKQLAERIDWHIEKAWKAKKAQPAPMATESEIIRRLFLDLAGRIPSIIEIHDFLDDDRPGKYQMWAQRLLKGLRKDRARDTYSDHFANLWTEWLIPSGSNPQVYGRNFQTWLRETLKKNEPYDAIVRSLLINNSSNANPTAAQIFYQAHRGTPEGLASATARLFLGVKLECAQCHDDRSGGNWSRMQFWELAAFFTNTRGNGTTPLRIGIPGTRRVAQAQFLDGTKPKANINGTTQITNWVTSPKNPWFGRAIVNRFWSYFFGIGLVEPFDEMGEHNPPSHPELLAEMAQQFVLHEHDLRYLLEAIVLSKPYRLSSRVSHSSQRDPRLFARMMVRGLSAAQLFDSLAEATEYEDEGPGTYQNFGPGAALTPRARFLKDYAGRIRSTETQTSILQALHLMNGSFTTRITSAERSPVIKTVAEAEGITTAERVQSLFLVTLSRKPSKKEEARYVKYIEGGGPTKNRQKALADLFWALINSPEFALNH